MVADSPPELLGDRVPKLLPAVVRGALLEPVAVVSLLPERREVLVGEGRPCVDLIRGDERHLDIERVRDFLEVLPECARLLGLERPHFHRRDYIRRRPQPIVRDVIREPRKINEDDIVPQGVDVLVEEPLKAGVLFVSVVDVPEVGVEAVGPWMGGDQVDPLCGFEYQIRDGAVTEFLCDRQPRLVSGDLLGVLAAHAKVFPEVSLFPREVEREDVLVEVGKRDAQVGDGRRFSRPTFVEERRRPECADYILILTELPIDLKSRQTGVAPLLWDNLQRGHRREEGDNRLRFFFILFRRRPRSPRRGVWRWGSVVTGRLDKCRMEGG